MNWFTYWWNWTPTDSMFYTSIMVVTAMIGILYTVWLSRNDEDPMK